MSESRIEFHDGEIRGLLDRLEPLGYRDQTIAALRKGAEVIAGQTKENLLRKPLQRPGSLTKGIIVWDEPDQMAAVVSIVGDYRLKFFENGTAERELRRSGKRLGGKKRDVDSAAQYPAGARRGSISQAKFGGFFADAVSNPEAARKVVVDELEKTIKSRQQI